MTNDVKHELWYLVRLQYTVVQKIHPFTFYFGFDKCQTICIIFGPQWHDLSSSTSSHACRRHIRPHTDAISVDSEVLRLFHGIPVYFRSFCILSIHFFLSFFLSGTVFRSISHLLRHFLSSTLAWRHTFSNSVTRNYCCRAREVTLSFMDTLIALTYLLTYLLPGLRFPLCIAAARPVPS